MKGSIYTSDKCPLCGGKLIHDENRGGLFCQKHPDQRARRRFRVRFDRNIQKQFPTFQQAVHFLPGLRFKQDEGTLDPRDYKASHPLGFRTQALKWLEVKKKASQAQFLPRY